MMRLNDALLTELGLGALPTAEKNDLLDHIYKTLEMRVGMRLAQEMSNAQLDEFEGFIDSGDEPGALLWLQENFPAYRLVVAEELASLKAEVSASASQILAASGVS